MQKAEAPNRHAPAQSRLHEPKFDNSHEAYEARHAALSEILKERVESGKINAGEASRAMFSFEGDGSLKYRNEVIARMWKHRDLRGDPRNRRRGSWLGTSGTPQRPRDGAVNGGKQRKYGGAGQNRDGPPTGRTVEQREADLAQAREVAAEVRAREAAERQQDRSRDREQEPER